MVCSVPIPRSPSRSQTPPTLIQFRGGVWKPVASHSRHSLTPSSPSSTLTKAFPWARNAPPHRKNSYPSCKAQLDRPFLSLPAWPLSGWDRELPECAAPRAQLARCKEAARAAALPRVWLDPGAGELPKEGEALPLSAPATPHPCPSRVLTVVTATPLPGTWDGRVPSASHTGSQTPGPHSQVANPGSSGGSDGLLLEMKPG